TERRDFAQLPSAYASPRETFRVQHCAQKRNNRALASRQLGFLLAVELSTRSAVAARSRNGVASCPMERQPERPKHHTESSLRKAKPGAFFGSGLLPFHFVVFLLLTSGACSHLLLLAA